MRRYRMLLHTHVCVTTILPTDVGIRPGQEDLVALPFCDGLGVGEEARLHVMRITCMSIFMSICTSVFFMFPSHRPLSLYCATKPGVKPHQRAWER